MEKFAYIPEINLDSILHCFSKKKNKLFPETNISDFTENNWLMRLVLLDRYASFDYVLLLGRPTMVGSTSFTNEIRGIDFSYPCMYVVKEILSKDGNINVFSLKGNYALVGFFLAGTFTKKLSCINDVFHHFLEVLAGKEICENTYNRLANPRSKANIALSLSERIYAASNRGMTGLSDQSTNIPINIPLENKMLPLEFKTAVCEFIKNLFMKYYHGKRFYNGSFEEIRGRIFSEDPTFIFRVTDKFQTLIISVDESGSITLLIGEFCHFDQKSLYYTFDPNDDHRNLLKLIKIDLSQLIDDIFHNVDYHMLTDCGLRFSLKNECGEWRNAYWDVCRYWD